MLRQHGRAVGTAHHSVVNVPGTDRWYVAYHRHAVPGGGGYKRQTCLVKMEFDEAGMIKPMEGWTNKFIFAPYEFTVADAMVTNFHLPYSTQLMMVAAFGGYETVMNAYKVAKEEGYRFGTYGDAMLIL